MAKRESILYDSEDGITTIGLQTVDGGVRLIQREIAEFLDRNEANVVHLDEMEKAAKGRKAGGKNE